MNPITRHLEKLGWKWSSKAQAYVYNKNQNTKIKYPEVKDMNFGQLEVYVKNVLSSKKRGGDN